MPLSTTAAPAVDRAGSLHALGELVPRLMRLVHAYKTAVTGDSRDRAALLLLFPLVRLGPLRQGALADLVHADPSTVSRHVGTLVERGLARRIADESDGRACRLVVTEDGHATLAALRAERSSQLADVTAAWTDADLTAFTDLFGRFVDDMAAVLPDDAVTAAANASLPAAGAAAGATTAAAAAAAAGDRSLSGPALTTQEATR